jgi:hypothetical protein
LEATSETRNCENPHPSPLPRFKRLEARSYSPLTRLTFDVRSIVVTLNRKLIGNPKIVAGNGNANIPSEWSQTLMTGKWVI